MKVGNKIILLSFLIVTTTVNAREPRTERTPYVQEANIVFDELELAFKQKDFPTIERLLTHLSNTAKRDGNLEDLASSYVELTDFFVEKYLRIKVLLRNSPKLILMLNKKAVNP